MPKGLETEKILAMFDIFMQTGSIDQTARKCNVNWHTVKKYVESMGWTKKRADYLQVGLKEIGLSNADIAMENLAILRAAKAKIAQGIMDGTVAANAGDIVAIMKMENLYTGGLTSRVDSQGTMLTNLIMTGQITDEQLQSGIDRLVDMGEQSRIKTSDN